MAVVVESCCEVLSVAKALRDSDACSIDYAEDSEAFGGGCACRPGIEITKADENQIIITTIFACVTRHFSPPMRSKPGRLRRKEDDRIPRAPVLVLKRYLIEQKHLRNASTVASVDRAQSRYADRSSNWIPCPRFPTGSLRDR